MKLYYSQPSQPISVVTQRFFLTSGGEVLRDDPNLTATKATTISPNIKNTFLMQNLTNKRCEMYVDLRNQFAT